MSGTAKVVLPERVIDMLFQSAGVSTYHPQGDQLDKLHAFAHAVTAEVIARLPSAQLAVPVAAQGEREQFEAYWKKISPSTYANDLRGWEACKDGWYYEDDAVRMAWHCWMTRADLAALVAAQEPRRRGGHVAAGHFRRSVGGAWHEVPRGFAGNEGVVILYHAEGWPAPAQGEPTTLPTDFTDEQLAAGLESIAIWRKQNGVLSDESLCGMVYDAMRAAAPAQPETWKVLPSRADSDPIRQLLAMHAELRETNSYCYFELAYTRRTNWMAFICDKPAGGTIGTPEFGEGRKILAQGQGSTPDRACENALRSFEERSKSTGEPIQEAKE